MRSSVLDRFSSWETLVVEVVFVEGRCRACAKWCGIARGARAVGMRRCMRRDVVGLVFLYGLLGHCFVRRCGFHWLQIGAKSDLGPVLSIGSAHRMFRH